jgi:hypothetical protein
METLPEYPKDLPKDIERLLQRAAIKWFKTENRPRISEGSLKKWDELIEEWIKDRSLPIFIRKKSLGRGREIVHREGRIIIPTDNMPANWSFSKAYHGCYFNKAEIKKMLENGEIPFAHALKKEEREFAKKIKVKPNFIDVNKKGWTVRHIQSVGLNEYKEINEIALEEIERHFKNFISPRNMFLVPKSLAGFGELSQVIKAMNSEV